MSKQKINLPASTVYKILLNKVQKTLLEGQRRIEEERVRTYQKTGQLIRTHVLRYADRAEYGAEVITNLAKDLGVDRSVLNRCVLFAEKYPHLAIGARGHQFKWSHYRKFITIADDKKRLRLQKAAAQNAWTAEELAVRIKEQNPSVSKNQELKVSTNKLLVPARGIPYTYKLVERPNLSTETDSGLLVDLGFGVYHEVELRFLSGFVEGDIVESQPKQDVYKFYKTGRTAKDLFTYSAYVEKVIDGDTLKVRLDLGFNVWTRQILRLRDLDCPEVDAAEGKEASIFVKSYLKEASQIIVRSSRSDKYDRYLADVFIPQGAEPDPETDVYLNNLLLETGRAKRF